MRSRDFSGDRTQRWRLGSLQVRSSNADSHRADTVSDLQGAFFPARTPEFRWRAPVRRSAWSPFLRLWRRRLGALLARAPGDQHYSVAGWAQTRRMNPCAPCTGSTTRARMSSAFLYSSPPSPSSLTRICLRMGAGNRFLFLTTHRAPHSRRGRARPWMQPTNRQWGRRKGSQYPWGRSVALALAARAFLRRAWVRVWPRRQRAARNVQPVASLCQRPPAAPPCACDAAPTRCTPSAARCRRPMMFGTPSSAGHRGALSLGRARRGPAAPSQTPRAPTPPRPS